MSGFADSCDFSYFGIDLSTVHQTLFSLVVSPLFLLVRPENRLFYGMGLLAWA